LGVFSHLLPREEPRKPFGQERREKIRLKSLGMAPELTELGFDSALALPSDGAGMSQPIHPLESDLSNTE
jgi:hypothetical protein